MPKNKNHPPKTIKYTNNSEKFNITVKKSRAEQKSTRRRARAGGWLKPRFWPLIRTRPTANVKNPLKVTPLPRSTTPLPRLTNGSYFDTIWAKVSTPCVSLIFYDNFHIYRVTAIPKWLIFPRNARL